MTNFLDSLGLKGNSNDIYISISTSNIMEIAIPDKSNGIKTYAQVPIQYNDSLREVVMDNFKESLLELYRLANIKPQGSNVHLSIPTVWFGYKDSIPLLLDDAAITNVILGDLEQTYIFKRKDPVPFWFDALSSTNSDSRSVFYTALQEDVKDSFISTFKEVGANLLSIECSVFSNLRGLYSAGFTVAQMDDPGYSWSLLVVNNSGYQLFGFQGKKFLEYYEEPLALRSYDENEIYSVVCDAAQIALMSTPSSSLVILSNTDYVSAEILSKHLQFNGNVLPIEDNKFKKESLIDLSQTLIPEDQLKVSLQIIGTTVPTSVLPVQLNFLTAGGEKTLRNDVIEIPIGNGKVIELTPMKATIYAALLLAFIVVVLGVIWGTSLMISNSAAKKIEGLDSQISEIDSQLSQYQKTNVNTSFDAVQEIQRVLKNNRTKIMAYTSLGESIPQNLYLTYFMTGDEGFIDVQGCANSVEDVYIFFQNLKDSLFESKLRLSKLDLKSGSLDAVINSDDSPLDKAPYVFEITNMNDSQLSGFMQALTSGASADQKAAENKAPDAANNSAPSAAPSMEPPSNKSKPPALPGLKGNNDASQLETDE